ARTPEEVGAPRTPACSARATRRRHRDTRGRNAPGGRRVHVPATLRLRPWGDGARVVVFKKATRAECVVCLPQHRLLVTCDSVQHYDHDPLISTLGKLVMYPMGFFTCSCRKIGRASCRGRVEVAGV